MVELVCLKGLIMKKEVCIWCGNETGKAGILDDSLYSCNGIGPWCEDCWKCLRVTIFDNLVDDLYYHSNDSDFIARVKEFINDVK